MKCPECESDLLLRGFDEGKSNVALACVQGHTTTRNMVEAYVPWFKQIFDRAAHIQKVMAATINNPSTRLGAVRSLEAMLASVAEAVLER